MLRLKPTWLENAYKWYVVDWLRDEWGYAREWLIHLPEMILWYSAAGVPYLGDGAADKFVRDVRSGGLRLLPPARRPTWGGAVRLTKEICTEEATNPVDWFTGGCGRLEVGWRRLDAIHGIGAKIASLFLRDLSFIRDFSDGRGGVTVRYGVRMDRRWFEQLAPEDQALFVPIDKHVHAGARKHGASPIVSRRDFPTIQRDPDLHREAATEIVRWARNWRFDPRDVDAYWYGVGAKEIHEDGTPIKKRGKPSCPTD